MSSFNSLHNRAVWFDIPSPTSIGPPRSTGRCSHRRQKQEFDGFAFCFLAHDRVTAAAWSRRRRDVDEWILVYLNVDGAFASDRAGREVRPKVKEPCSDRSHGFGDRAATASPHRATRGRRLPGADRSIAHAELARHMRVL